MRQKGNRIHSIILIICFLASCLCFDGIKAGDVVRLSGATEVSGQFITTGNDIPSDDVCTLEMLGNVQTGFLALPTTKRGSDSQRESDSFVCMPADSQNLLSVYKFLSSANAIIAVNACIAEILCFIHDKDGKKRCFKIWNIYF
jgi:hypothetical protein